MSRGARPCRTSWAEYRFTHRSPKICLAAIRLWAAQTTVGGERLDLVPPGD